MIAIVGATGMIGLPVTRELIQAGNDVRIVASDVAAVKRPEGIHGDLRDLASLQTALTGVGTVYLNLSIRQTEKRTSFHTETDGLKNLLTAAKRMGV